MTAQSTGIDTPTPTEPLLLSLIDWAETKDFDLPTDLSEKHDEYLWQRAEQEE